MPLICLQISWKHEWCVWRKNFCGDYSNGGNWLQEVVHRGEFRWATRKKVISRVERDGANETLESAIIRAVTSGLMVQAIADMAVDEKKLIMPEAKLVAEREIKKCWGCTAVGIKSSTVTTPIVKRLILVGRSIETIATKKAAATQKNVGLLKFRRRRHLVKRSSIKRSVCQRP